MRLKGVFLFVLLTMSCSSIVMADTIFNGKPFNGFYVGLQAGYGHAEDEVTDSLGLGITLDLGSSGAMFGFLGGWGTTLDSINPNIYAGIEGQYNFQDRDGEASIGATLLGSSLGLEWEGDDDWNIGGRLGYLFSENTMVFTRVAYASLDADISINDPGAIIPFPVSIDVDDLDGIQLGLGVEHHFGDNFTLRGEFVYSDYGSADINVTALGTTAKLAEVDVTSTEGRIAISYSF